MRSIRPFIAFASGLWLAACSVELGSQGDVVPTEDPPSGVVTPGASPSDPQAPTGPRTPTGPSSPGSVATVDASAELPDAAVGGSQDAASAEPDAGASAQSDAAPPLVADAGSASSLTFALASPAFNAGSTIPLAHTCKGEDVSPAFVWQGAPAGTKSFALVLTAHTAFLGTTVDYQRWVMWNIPASRSALPASIEEGHTPSDVPGAIQASNETEGYASGAGAPGGWAGGGNIAGGMVAGGFTGGPGGGPGGSFGGGSSDDAKSGRRYRGPCTYGFPQTFEFVLYALDGKPEPPAWRLGITPDEIVEWLTTEASVLGTARLPGVTP